MARAALRTYPAELKAEFLWLVRERQIISTVVHEFGIHRPTAYARVRKAGMSTCEARKVNPRCEEFGASAECGTHTRRGQSPPGLSVDVAMHDLEFWSRRRTVFGLSSPAHLRPVVAIVDTTFGQGWGEVKSQRDGFRSEAFLRTAQRPRRHQIGLTCFASTEADSSESWTRNYAVQLSGSYSTTPPVLPARHRPGSAHRRQTRNRRAELNDRPRKSLDWDTPAEHLSALLEVS